MCGLFGWQWQKGKIPSSEAAHRLATSLAEAMDKRGGQSWGVWSPRLLMRGLGQAAPNSARFSGVSSLFGHSRWATHGANTLENTHPFARNGIALSHNGVISNHSAMNESLGRTHVVDSEHLLSHMVEGRPFADIQAYGAMTWSRANAQGRIFLGKLSETGSLCVAQTSQGLVWASTDEAVVAACTLAGIQLDQTYKLEAGKVYIAQGGKLYLDEKHSSILVSTPVVVRRWEDFGHSSQRGSWGAYTVLWCNLHKKRYSQCPCQGGVTNLNVLTCPIEDVPKVGEEYHPDIMQPAHNSQSGWVGPLCVLGDCREPQTVRTRWCTKHEAEVAATTARGKNSQSARNATFFCVTQGCIVPAGSQTIFCPVHELPAPKTINPVAQPTRKAVEMSDSYDAWESGAEVLSERARKQLACNLAQRWLQDRHDASQQDILGLTATEVLYLAEELGFDGEYAVYLTLTRKDESNVESAEASV